MSRIPSDQKTHKLARRALIRAKESARISHMLPDDSRVTMPKRDSKAWKRLGLRAVVLCLALLATAPAMAWGTSGASHAGNHGHKSTGSNGSSNWAGLYGKGK